MSFRDLTMLQRRYSGQAGQLVSEFYMPVLRHSYRYDRQAGYFDSATLVQLAAGLAGFIDSVTSGGTTLTFDRPPMRLITGATWAEADRQAFMQGHEMLMESLGRSLASRCFEPSAEECLRLGLPQGWRPTEDQIARHRLGTLAWMVSRGLLEVRIALPLDHLGRPYEPGRDGGLFHPKAGILYNGEGNRIFFQGSVNETGAAWTRNREKFEVKRSWFSAQDAEDIQAEIEEFERIWNGREPGLKVLDLPVAVKDHLALFQPDERPTRDVMDNDEAVAATSLTDRIAAQFLLDAPQMRGGEGLVLHPLASSFQPYPHQQKVYQRAVAEFPKSFLFCDEVGLGKTIEAGLALRHLMLKGELRRVLIIAPRDLIRQWQEELREKFALTAWFYDGSTLTDVGGRIRVPDRPPWDDESLLIVSRHYIMRQARREEVLRLDHPWDAVIVDEAHAARRQAFRRHEPNFLLSLLQALRRQRLYRTLWLLTATPMQLDPLEVHDLLLLCGLDDPRWGDWRSETVFTRFFLDLSRYGTHREARQAVHRMTAVAVDAGAEPLRDDPAPQGWNGFHWQRFVDRINHNRPGVALDLDRLTGEQAEGITPYLARQTPLAVYMFRHTRATLRVYREAGRLNSLVPVRHPEDLPVSFPSQQERDLYERIDELCSRFYRLADIPSDERSGVGFLMAVFRKRLSSSFAAFKKSLERRRDFIVRAQQGWIDQRLQLAIEEEWHEEQEEEENSEQPRQLIDVERERLHRLRRQQVEEERSYIQDYLTALGQIHHDSKFQAFRRRLDALVNGGQRVIVFTQYLDTLDYIREQLVASFGDRLICYSGRGGEIWDGNLNGWRIVEKSEVKARSRKDHPRAATVLLGTDAASEGLNLQEFSALINYDLPWNPMRVEQRIGRIDRIGQEAPRVTILNLYLEHTIEHDAYVILRRRIGFFEDVVGPLQPILAEVPRIFRRWARGEIEREEAARMLQDLPTEPRSKITPLEVCVREEENQTDTNSESELPVTQAQLAAWCLQHPAPGMILQVCPEPGTAVVEPDGTKGCLKLRWAYAPEYLGFEATDELLVTFNPDLADRHPPTAPQLDEADQRQKGREGVRLLTWGDPLLEAWLRDVRGEEIDPTCLGLYGLLRGATGDYTVGTEQNNRLMFTRLLPLLHANS
jgi:superfamily II DNA or RNA helicase